MILQVTDLLLNLKGIDILSLSETHLSGKSNNSEVEINGYTFINKNRRSGGGVGSYISDNIPWHRREDLELNAVECIWIEISFHNTKGLLVGVSISPTGYSSNYLPKDFNTLLDCILACIDKEEKETIMLGDMNCNFLQRNANRDLKSILRGHGLKQLVNKPTRISKESSTLPSEFATYTLSQQA